MGIIFFKPLKEDRSIWVFILLNIVTCGIYSFVFLYEMIEAINIACDGDDEETPSLVMLILLSIVTCGIYSFYFYYKMGNRLAVNAARYGLYFPETGTTVLLWMLLGSFLCGVGPLIAMNILITNTNKICSAYNAYNYAMAAKATQEATNSTEQTEE